jgi:MFS family permease
MYTIAYIDRTNISLALPSLAAELGMTPQQAGSAAGVFFWGYLLLQVPGGYLAERWSAKKVVGILLVLWGACAAGGGLVHSARQLWVMRLLLGVAEGGVFPATIILLANWFPPAERARANACWMLCQPVAIVVSSPLSGWILGHWNWRVLLIAEGALPLAWLGVWLAAIDDRPADARWLSAEERAVLTEGLRPPAPAPAQVGRTSRSRPRAIAAVAILVVLYFFLNCGGYGYLFWLPSALLSLKKLSSFWLGVLYAVPYLLTCGGMVLNSRHSDASGERHLHVAFPLLLGGVLLFGSVAASGVSPCLSFVLICLAGASFYSSLGPLWTLPTEILPARSAGVAAGLINALGNLGGYVGPLMVGWLRGQRGNYHAAFETLAGCLLVAGLMGCLLKLSAAQRRTEPESAYKPCR